MILINFLIALISQAYEESMSNAEIKMFSHMAELNRECYLTYHFFNKLEPIDCYILQTPPFYNIDDNFSGITHETKQIME